jgi:large subunit ribosomal protein L29
MTAAEIRNLSPEQILKKIDESRDELFKVKIQVSTQQFTKVSEIKRIKKIISRLNTVYKEKQLEARS